MKNIFTKENLKNFITNQFVVFFAILFLFFAVNFYFTESSFPSPDTKNLWFYSGVFMVLFSILFIDKYYNSPKNVITNIIPLLLVFLSIKEGFQNQILWHIIFWLFFVLLIFSILPLFKDEKEGPASLWNNVLEWIKNIVSYIGQGKIIYSVVFLIFLYLKFSTKSFEIEYLVWLAIWGFVLLIDPKKLNNAFSFKKQILNEYALGEIIGVQSKKMFLVRLFERRKSIRKTDLVKFKYSMEEKAEKNYFISGLVFDTYLLNQEKWMKVLQLEREDEVDNTKDFEKNIVYKVSNEEEIILKEKLKVDKFIGVVAEGSNIGKIKFEYLERDNFVEDGDLLELKIGDKNIFYQVVNAQTIVDKLEFKNETGFIQGEAVQLGEWVEDKLSFQKYGWVPSVNTPIFLADTEKLEVKNFEYPDYKLGVIPKTKLPSIINLNDAVSHHMALLGVTGAGKSYLARKIINELNDNGIKVICVDFNNEFIEELIPNPTSIVSKEISKEIFNEIPKLNNALVGNYGKKDEGAINGHKSKIFNCFKKEIDKFLNSEKKEIKIFELPEISNNGNSLDYTRYFFDTLFKIVRDNYQGENKKSISIVLEEAHTIIPEWNFAGTSDKTSQSLVNNIGQIALQGRKYGIGFLVIAQRTANVSKTVLTQCNTVICFQAFDDTSISFLSNYVGKDLIQALPNLKPRHAIVVGKASKSNLPMIVDLDDEKGEESDNDDG